MEQQKPSKPQFKSVDPLGFVRFILADVATKATKVGATLEGKKYDDSSVEAALRMADIFEAEAGRLRGVVLHNAVEKQEFVTLVRPER